ncbi:MAG TPA: DUF4388 domain-containing protein [Kofleriaceae bacterium]|nr:DUF4388 domain-containing protein [Kofleriaceae bacterium]
MPPKLFVVSNLAEREMLSAAIAQAGLGAAAWGDGSDDTLTAFRASPPDAVVVCAGLDRGDARSLCAAMRADAGERVPIILIGDDHGPIRNALDAAGFEVDRFVSRPLSPKALGFAVKTSVQAARRAAAARMDAVEEQAIDAAVNDAIAAIVTAPVNVPEVSAEDTQHGPEIEPEPAPAVPTWREPTLILPAGSGPSHPGAGDTLTIDPRVADGQLIQSSPSDLARELSRKMSLMAERLFPGQSPPASVTTGADHRAHTDLDLAAFDVPAMTDGNGLTDGAADNTALFAPPTLTETATGDAMAETVTGASDGAGKSHGSLGRGTLIRGTLDGPGSKDVATVLARLFLDGFTGRVIFREPPAEKTLHVDRGRPVFATSNLPHDRMGELLYREGKITRDQHARCRKLVADSGRRMGQILVEKGFLKPRELLPAVRRHVEDIIYSLFGWRRGELSSVAGDAAVGEKIRLSRHPAAVVLEGVRRKYDARFLSERFGSMGSLVRLGSGERTDAVLTACELPAAEHAAVMALDGQRTLTEVADEANLDALTVHQLAFGLCALEVAVVVHRAGDIAADSEAASPDEKTLVGKADIAIDRQRVLAKHALVVESDYFSLLGVRRDATTFEIRRAYEASRRDFLPQSFSPEVQDELSGQLSEIGATLHEAYRVLGDAAVRAAYLENLRD